MTGSSFADLPPPDPPPGCPTPMLWRVARRLYLDHQLLMFEELAYCGRCGEAWPCDGRKLGERGLVAMVRAVAPDSERPWWRPRPPDAG